MGAKACRGLIGEGQRWHANKILWDCNEKKELPLVPGEWVHKEWNDVEDCVSGLTGKLQLTTLRLIWQSHEDPSKNYHPNISVGLKVIQSVQFNVNESKHYGRCRTLAVSTRFLDETYEFSFAMTPGTVNEAFHIFESWNKRFKASRVFRESLVREMKMTKSNVGPLLYYPEKLIQEIPRVENIAASKKYSGKFILTTHRLIWVSTRSSIVNVSIPFLELRMIGMRSTPYGLGLVVCASNISLSQKQCHLKQGIREGDNSIVLGFKFPSVAQVAEIHKFAQERQRDLAENPFYMPEDGRVIHRIGRWMIVDDHTWREEMGMNDQDDDDDDDNNDSPFFQRLAAPDQAPPNSVSGDHSLEAEFDDPLTPHATPVRQLDLGGGAELLADLAQFDQVPSNHTEPTAASNSDQPSSSTTVPGMGSANEAPSSTRNASRPKTPLAPTSPTAAAYRKNPVCVICLTKNANLAFDPCGHMCSCKGCGENLKECPMCRQEITKALKVYVVS